VLWIRIGCNAIPDPDPNPAFYLDADPETDPDPGSQTDADPGGPGSRSWSDFYCKSQKVKVKKHTYEGIKAFLKGRKPGLLLNFNHFPDPHSQNGSGSKTAK
jgi:hypothetical protein